MEPAATVSQGGTVAEFNPAEKSVFVGTQAQELVGEVARSVGFGGATFEEMSGTWLRQIVEHGVNPKAGVETAQRVVNFLGALLMGQKSRIALEDAGLTWAKLILLMNNCKDFEKVLLACYDVRKKANELRKESMGEDVLATAYEMAVDGEQQYSLKTGENLGFKKKSEKMLDRLLVMSGKEFRREGNGASNANAVVEKPAVTLTFNFGGGRAQSMEVIDVQQQ